MAIKIKMKSKKAHPETKAQEKAEEKGGKKPGFMIFKKKKK